MIKEPTTWLPVQGILGAIAISNYKKLHPKSFDDVFDCLFNYQSSLTSLIKYHSDKWIKILKISFIIIYYSVMVLAVLRHTKKIEPGYSSIMRNFFPIELVMYVFLTTLWKMINETLSEPFGNQIASTNPKEILDQHIRTKEWICKFYRNNLRRENVTIHPFNHQR